MRPLSTARHGWPISQEREGAPARERPRGFVLRSLQAHAQPGADRAGVGLEGGEPDVGAPLQLGDIRLRDAHALGHRGLGETGAHARLGQRLPPFVPGAPAPLDPGAPEFRGAQASRSPRSSNASSAAGPNRVTAVPSA